MFDVGRVCIKTAGRESGSYCVVVKKIDSNFVMITGPRPLTGVRRRKCNINHLEPMLERVKISADASDSDVMGAWEQSNLITKLGMKEPDASELAELAAKKEEKEKKKTETKKKEPKKEEKKRHKEAKKEEKKEK